MNKLKKIYYPVLAVLLVLLVVFSTLSVKVNLSTPFISTSLAKSNAEAIATAGNYDISDDNLASSGDRTEVVSEINTIIKGIIEDKYKALYNTNGSDITLTSTSSSSVSSILMGQYVVKDINDNETKKYELAPVYYSSSISVDADGMNAIPNAKEKGYAKGMKFQNVVLYIPGSQIKNDIAKNAQDNKFTYCDGQEAPPSDVVMLVAHYDSTVGDNGYINNSITIGTMLALFNEIVNGNRSYKNDIIMLFTDASYNNGLGLDFFMNSPRYKDMFGEARKRIKSVAIFDNVGEVSTIIASQAKGSDTVSMFATAGDWYHSGSFSGSIASANVGGKEFEKLNGVSAIEILGVGNKYEITTANSLTSETLNRVATVIGSYVDRVGNADLGVLDNNAIIGFYSYLGLNFWFASYVAYIIGALLLILVGFTVWYLIKKKTFNPVKAGFGVAVSVLSVIATVATITVLYLLLALLLSLIGAISVFAIGTVMTDNVFFFMLAFVLSIVLLTVYNTLFRNVFKVKALDAVRGNAWFVMLVAIVMSFAFPTYSYLFMGLAITQGATMLCTILFKDKFKQKFGFDVERLMLYGAFAILLLPVVFAEALVVYSVSPAIFLGLILSIVLIYAQSVIPYVLIIKDLLGISSKKEKEVKAEEEAKPKAKPLLSKKVVILVSLFTVFAYAVASLVGVLSINHTGLTSLQSTFNGGDAIYNNAFIYEYNDVNGKKSQSILLKDLDLHSYMKNNLSAFSWNANKNAYAISDNTDSSLLLPTGSNSYVPYYKHSSSKLFMFSKDNYGNEIRLGSKSAIKPAMTITFSTVKAGDKITSVRLVNNISSYTSTESMTNKNYDEFVVNGNTITLTIPAGYGTSLAVEVFAKSKEGFIPVIDLNVKVNAVYVAGNLNQLGDLSAVGVNNNTISSLMTEYSTDKTAQNINFVFEYNYEGRTTIPTV